MSARPSENVVEILRTLVGFDTTSNRSNLPLVEWVRDYLESHGITATVVPNEAGDKACLFAHVGPADRPAIGLSAHTDVVPVAGQNWTSDPFILTEREDRLYGRGSCDMKGFVSLALAALQRLAATDLKTPVQLVLTYDEETTFDGVVDAIRQLDRSWERPSALIVGEPTSMQVVDAHLSIAGMRMEITGRAAHSSAPDRGANAIFAANDIINELVRVREEFIAHGDPTGRFDPPHSTLNVGRIKGGTAHNIVAEHCMIEFGMRGVPGLDLEAVLDRMERFAQEEVLPKLRATAPESEIKAERWLFNPCLSPEPGSAAEQLAFRLAGANATHTVTYATEAGMYQQAGIPTVVCGPGSIDQAHAPDEYIELSQLALGEAFFDRLLAVCRA